jgi:glycerol-3-phosphate acyltransferase PlsY
MNHFFLHDASLIALAYFLGSIPFGLLLTRLAGLGDIRNIGSGNIGATNVLRTGNKKIAALTLLLDGLKSAVAVLIVAYVSLDLAPYAALAAVAGHIFPIWLNFRGGKGVATSIGAIAALHWPAGLILAVIWIATILITRYSSLAGLLGVGAAPLVVCITGRCDLLSIAAVIVLMVGFKHRDNIRRLINKTEPKVGASHAAARVK